MYTAQGKLDRSDTVTSHMPMVRRHALALQVRLPPSVELEDLVQAGLVGLLDAVDRFAPDQGASFETYASRRVRGAMIDELRSRDWLPRSVRRSSRALDKAVQDLQHRLGRAPSEREIAAELDVPVEEYHQLLLDVNNGYIATYEEFGTAGREPSHVNGVPQAFEAPAEAMFASAERGQLAESIEKLPDREKTLLGLYYQEELNLREIGAVLGVTESRVCQLHSQAVTRLRAHMADVL